jgi:hypothetical protein
MASFGGEVSEAIVEVGSLDAVCFQDLQGVSED